MNLKKIALTLGFATTCIAFINCTETGTSAKQNPKANDSAAAVAKTEEEPDAPATSSEYPPIDTAKYNQKLLEIANGDTTGRWPVKNQPMLLFAIAAPTCSRCSC